MADFEDNPFADPNNINPFAVSYVCVCIWFIAFAYLPLSVRLSVCLSACLSLSMIVCFS